MSTLLEIISVSKSFGAVRALHRVSFDLRAGEVHALLGENGAGKSTLIKVITGAHAPDSGQLRIAGLPVRRFSPATALSLGVACVYQQPALFPDLTVAENIALRLDSVAPLRRVNWRERHRRASELLARIGADVSPRAEVGSLSMPEQQLVEVACAVGSRARIVIMDEPTASLTRSEQERLHGIVRDLRATGVGVIYISHRLEEVFALADRVTVLRDGESVATRPVAMSVPDSVPEAAGLPVSHEAELIRLMVGREVSQLFPPAEGAPGKPVLTLVGVGCAMSGVRNVSLEVRAGEVVGLAGLVGAGRTELARVLFGLTPADSGEIRLGGIAATLRSPREAIARGIAYLPEDRRRHGVILEMPIAHNVTLAIHPRLFPRLWLRLRAERNLAMDYMRSLAVKAATPEAAVGALSGGNQQKVALARWLATQPKLLILDEPTQGVDVGAKGEIHGLIRRLAAQGMAVLMISSDLTEILGMSDRIGVMRGGTLAAMLPGNSGAGEVMSAALGLVSPEQEAG